MSIKEIKKEFPIFENNSGLVFLDNASTTQKPKQVIDKLIEVYTHYNSNVHRGLYPIAEKTSLEYENARQKIATFINANPKEITFTSGTTDSTNLIAESLARSGIIPAEPKVLTTEQEHHANFLPWQRITKGKLDYNYNPNTQYDVVVYTIISNVTGTYTDIKELKKQPNLKNAIFIADAAQAVAHKKLDVKDMDTDFLVFSGHKMFGPTGIGVLYGKQELLEKMEPFKVGGGMISEVTKESATWAELPEKFEAGTPPIADAIALGAAINFINSIGFDEIEKHEQNLRKYLVNKLKQIPQIKIFHPKLNEYAAGVVSFVSLNVHAHDIAQFLGDFNICVRAGHHCTQILHKEVFQVPASVRISLSVYNTEEDINQLIESLKKAIEYFSKKD
ncbi:cysteine desulfurase / selenocysteine lyase [Patescibacteria group bacterium]|nr:aminotransferase class V-fold PLP-dependent enzyme [Candidatus Dojkabacteria bacterium]CAG1021425.1 cysteine desulfurase / selenocysteine lyase [Patescibacteria group bacterium]